MEGTNQPRLLDQVSARIRYLHYSLKTEQASKGGTNTITMLPEFVVPGLQSAIEKARSYHAQDQIAGICHVCLPGSLARKYPSADIDSL